MSANQFHESLLIDLQCIPCISYMKLLIGYSRWVFDIYLYHEKRSYANRFYVAGPNGRVLISIPLEKGKRQHTPMKDIRIYNREHWQAHHWKTLVSAYRRSPWFEYFEDDLLPFFEKPYHFLVDWNRDWLVWICRVLGLEARIDFTDHFISPEEAAAVGMDFRGRIQPPPGRMHPGVRYHQVFEDRTGFMADLSIFDLICCEGRKALAVLQAKSVQE
ncbi:WbqC family protein [Thermoflavifilum sp.]|uniref:WbqC family protein n=1 Tax=Thermoflavifilum sp. TaxID=1968839 RepID=UPI0025DC911C|nr:WbqC family protein [Thermoflavifilum sp.]